MRPLIALLLLVPALAGCTTPNGQVEFEQSCPSWVTYDGKPAATVASAMYKNQSGEIVTAHLKGVHVFTPGLLIEDPYVWKGAPLDVFEWSIKGRDQHGKVSTVVADGYYVIKAFAADKDIKPESDGKSVTWDTKYRQDRLYFRDVSAPEGSQYKSEIILDQTTGKSWQDVGYEFANHTYRIELGVPGEKAEPKALWIEYQFFPNLDKDNDTPSEGLLSTGIRFWYNTCLVE